MRKAALVAVAALAAIVQVYSVYAGEWEYTVNIDPMNDVKTESAINSKEADNPFRISFIGFSCIGDSFVFATKKSMPFHMDRNIDLTFRIEKDKAVKTILSWDQKNMAAVAGGNDALGYAKSFAKAKETVVVKLGDGDPVIYGADQDGSIVKAAASCGLSLR